MLALGPAALVLVAAVPDYAHSREDPQLDPTGVWSCVVYGGVPADERIVLRLVADGGAMLARQGLDSTSYWAPLSDWAVERAELEFTDYRNSRRYAADLRRPKLGGEWTSPRGHGGWWCMRTADGAELDTRVSSQSAAEFFVPPLVPDVSVSPMYPRQAIRDATEGRAVVCFVVDSSGVILEPEIVELSDEIFRDSTMLAVHRTRYRPWDAGALPRAGCRSYTFELDAVF